MVLNRLTRCAAGPFGCGKTHTLAALVRHLCTTLDAQRSAKRILVAGFTNACVDGLLCALLDHGFTDFVRAGSLRRIALRVLPYAVGSKSGSKSSDERDLKALLATAATPAARAVVERELAALAAGRMAARARRLNTCRVVAVTTASCTQERLSSLKFDIVLIDEACQLNEPSALLPLVRFGARCVILVGDHAQLPPLLTNVDEHCDDGIQRPLFLRLLAAGHSSLLLRTQYRCHPQLSALSNALYYDGRLLDGVSAAERQPLLPSLLPLTVLDVTCGSSRAADAELQLASRLVQTLLTCGVPPESIAVLCFLNVHVATIQRSLAVRPDETTGDGVLTVSSIDAFQGQEREVIILVASGMQPGFATPQRVNVALSRARRHLLCICRSASSCQGMPWMDKLLRSSRPVPRSYLRLADPRAPLPRWHEAVAPPQPSPSAAPVDVPVPSPASSPADAPPPHGRMVDASPAQSGSAHISIDADEDEDDIIEMSVEAPAADEDTVPYLCSPAAEALFAACAFDSADLWTGYKLYQFHSYAKKPANAERAAFFATKLGKVCQKLCAVRSGQLIQTAFVRTYVMAKAYVARHGADGAHGVRLATLLARHEDMDALRREHPAFAWHIEKDAVDESDEEEDEEPRAKAPRAETDAAVPPAAAADDDFIDLSGTPASPAREAERAEQLSVDNYLF